ncbi:MAG TPA: hypothetical protein VGB73_03645 [Pyrinomonadaceae bacterium]|jgi:hypothetical protein
MSSKLTVIFYIILCLEAGIVLTFLPWVHPFGLGDWGDNYFLLYASQKVGLQGLQSAISSGWVRGAVTGLGLLNLGMAFWEMAHFRRTVQDLGAQEKEAPKLRAASPYVDVPQDRTDARLPDYERRDQPRDHSGQ